ncbi:MAG: 4Fe-4S cluster-binding domain-containing protein [Spirochaetales bacterium]|nr:4Fe-4S cluster-binding domain-containing protein [Spirochaetales bacterium]
MIFAIKEKYITISGEAPVPGVPVYLLRFSGCNLKCTYCDTPFVEQVTYRFTEKEMLKDIHHHLLHYPFLKLLFTGGEPLACEREDALFSLIHNLKGKPDVYIETNGSIDIPSFPKHTHIVCDWKTPSSGCENSFKPDNLKLLRPGNDCIKFVINKEDFDWVNEKIQMAKKENPGLPLYLSPQWGSLSYKDLAEFILKNRLPAAMSVQLHKIIWGSEKEGIHNGTII